MAAACGMDPLTFRLKNYAEVEPMTGKPFSSKALRECYAAGRRANSAGRAARWRRGRCATRTACWSAGAWARPSFPALMFPAQARAALRRDGTGMVEIGAHDMGQGAWTALAQIAADALGLDLDRVEFRSGTSDLPDGGIAGGSGHTATAGAAIHAAGARRRSPSWPTLATGDRAVAAVRRRQCGRDRARRPAAPPRRRGGSESYADILARAGLDEIDGSGTGRAPIRRRRRPYAMHAHGAVFAEVKVDPDLGQVRVTRLVGAFAAGADHQPAPGAQPDISAA